MHGCPPDEIERISRYLIEDRGLHTTVKCNPTLLGAEKVRGIVHDELRLADAPIPDEAFGPDLTSADAAPSSRRVLMPRLSLASSTGSASTLNRLRTAKPTTSNRSG